MTPTTISHTDPIADLALPAGPVEDHPSLQEARFVLPRTVAHLEAGRDAGLHPGTQVHVSIDGRTRASFALGWARAGVPMTPATKLPWFCCVKPAVAIALLQCWEEGLVDLDDPLASVLAGFGAHGKDRITFRDVLSHAVGLVPDPVYAALDGGRDEARLAIQRAALPEDARPGAVAYYSALWGWFAVAEAIEVLRQRPYQEVVAERVFGPLGITDIDLGYPAHAWPDAAEGLGLIYDVNTDRPVPFGFLTEPGHYERWAPGAAGFGPASAFAALIEALLPGDGRVLAGPTASAMRSRQRVGFYDAHYASYLSWGLGVAVDGWHYGRHCSPNTFGHTGLNTSVLMADPRNRLVVASVSNGMCSGPESLARDRGLVDAVYADLGLDGGSAAAPQIVAVEPSTVPGWKQTVAQENHYWRVESKGLPQ